MRQSIFEVFQQNQKKNKSSKRERLNQKMMEAFNKAYECKELRQDLIDITETYILTLNCISDARKIM
jgi:hypothetical protein